MPRKWQGMNFVRKDLRLALYLRDGMACVWCGATLEDGAKLTLDHVVPHAHGGSDKPDNLVTACHTCNSVRADRPAAEFARAAAEYLNHGISAGAILAYLEGQLQIPVAPYRLQAKAIIARRPTWTAALHTATTERI